MSKFYQEVYGVPVSILRLFNVYGPKTNKGVISKIIKCVENGETMQVYGDGEQTRDFVHVNDVVRACVSANPGIFNIASGKNVKIKDLVEMFGVKHEFLPSIKGEIVHSSASIEKAAKSFGFEPKFQLDGFVREAIADA
jgi:UDP-glucose 4-epimerase